MKTRKYIYLLALLSGLLLGLSVILPEIFGALEWISLVPFFLSLIPSGERVTQKTKRYFLSGFLFYLAYGMTYFHWFWALFPLDFTGLSDVESIVVILLAWLGLSALYALLGGLLFLLVALFARLGTFERTPMLAIVIYPTVFVLYEFILTLDWWGVPWGKLALGQMAFLPGLQTASLFGSYFICALIVFVNVCVAYLFVYRKNISLRVLPLSFALCSLFLNTVVGAFLYQRTATLEENQPTVSIAVLQGNNPSQDNISDADSFHHYIELSEEAIKAGADVVVWPESSIAGAISKGNYFGKYASQFADVYDVYLIIGSTTFRDGKEYNTMTLIDREGNLCASYDKRRLVPFGEFVPYRTFFETVAPPLVEVTMLEQDCSAGETPAVFDREDIGKLGGLICFESIYERLALDTVRDGAEIFVVGTNDSWFRRSLATRMHTAHEQLRSIECGRYSTRASCTGLTCFINSRGEIVDALPLYEDGFLLREVPRLSYTTLYARVGDLVVPLSCVWLFTLFALSMYRKKKEK